MCSLYEWHDAAAPSVPVAPGPASATAAARVRRANLSAGGLSSPLLLRHAPGLPRAGVAPDPDGAAVHVHGSGRCSPSGPGAALVRRRLLGVAVAANGSNGRFPRLPRTRRGGWSSALGGLEKKAAAASGQEEQRQRLVHGASWLHVVCVCVLRLPAGCHKPEFTELDGPAWEWIYTWAQLGRAVGGSQAK